MICQFRARAPVVAACLVVLLSGCATFSADAGMDAVTERVAADTGDQPIKIDSDQAAERADSEVAALLSRPLTADGTARVALLQSRALQAEYNRLGLSEAGLVEASLPPNPTVSVSKLISAGEFEIERAIIGNLLGLLAMPARREVARARFEQAQLSAVNETLLTAAEARKAFYRAVAARETVRFLEQAHQSADVARELAERLRQTGAAPRVVEARAQALAAEVAAELTAARLTVKLEREALIRALGLQGPDPQFQLPDRLPRMPGLVPIGDVEEQTVLRRADLIAARLGLEALARELRLEKATGYVSLLELAGVSRTVVDGGAATHDFPVGFELEVEIPIFDGGEVRRRRANETYQAALNELVSLVVNARSEARAAYETYRSTHRVARLYADSIVPLRKIVSDETMLQYNGMLADIFDILTAARESVESNMAAINAKRDFLLAEVDLRSAMIGGRGGSDAGAADNQVVVARSEAPAH